MTNIRNSVFYTGVTNNLALRVWQHKNKTIQGFTATYNINKLVYFEICYHPQDAILREKQIKRLHRKNKLKLISKDNADFKDLSIDLF